MSCVKVFEVQPINLIVMSQEELGRNMNHGHEFPHVGIDNSVINCDSTTFPCADA